MKVIEKSGNSIQEILLEFRKENRLKEWEFDYEVLVSPSKGLFGLIGARKAKLKLTIPEMSIRIRKFTEELLTQLDLGYTDVTVKTEGKVCYVSIHDCSDPGFLIGKNGSMLENLQYFINRIFENQREIDKIYLDSEGYRMRKEDQYLRMFSPLIKKVHSSGKPLTLEPMNAGERRIIHKYVERDRNLRTLTIGEGDKKRIVIFGSKQTEKEAMAQIRQAKANPAKPVEKAEEIKELKTDEKPVKPAAKPRPRPPRSNKPSTPRPPRPPRKEKTEQ